MSGPIRVLRTPLAFAFLTAVLLTVLEAETADAASEKATKDLRSAIGNAKRGTAKKVATARLKRAIDNAKKQGIDSDLLREAEAQLQDQSEAEEKVRLARAGLCKATEASSAAQLEEALRLARQAGLTRGSEVTAAEKRFEELGKEKKKAERLETKRRNAFRQLAKRSSTKPVDVQGLRAALAAAKALLVGGTRDSERNATEGELVAMAEEALRAAEFESLPLSERFERASIAFSREHCRPAVDAGTGVSAMCRPFAPEALAKQSRAVGDKNCDHPTLRPGGPPAPQENAAPPETSKHFCKYPPPFDLQEAEDGRGYRPTEFSFPQGLFDASMLQEGSFVELAVLNLNMDLFRTRIASCAANELWLIEFYVHWCPHCQAVMPKFYKLAIALRAAGVNLHVGAVNCATQKDLCGAFQVMGHPLIAFVYGGVGPDGRMQLFEYSGRDLRVNTALDSLKRNADPSWFRGSPQEMPKHLFPAEMANDLLYHLPEEYRPAEAVLRWLGNSSRTTATACPEARRWYSPRPAGNNDSAQKVEDSSTPKKPKFAGNGWPAVERVVTPAHRLQDAAQALVYTLDEWVQPNPAGPSPHGFAYAELVDLHGWVSHLVRSFPTVAEGGLPLESELRELASRLLARVRELEAGGGAAALCVDEWRRLVRPVRRAFEAARSKKSLLTTCRTETCRMWTLLHTLSVARLARAEGEPAAGGPVEPVAEGGADAPDDTASNGAAFNATIAFLRRYFTCRTCRQHFLEQVEAGAHGFNEARSGDEPRALALWWWRLHGAVSARVAREGRCHADRRWPPADLCVGCWIPGAAREDTNDTAVVEELLRQFWPRTGHEAVGEASVDVAGGSLPAPTGEGDATPGSRSKTEL